MKLLITLLICLNLTFLVTAQTKKEIAVMSGHSEIQQVDRKGMQVLIELDEKFVSKNWAQKLKEFGKVETDKGNFILHGASIPDISTACTIYSNVVSTSKGVFVFWAIDLGSEYIIEGHSKYDAAKKKLRDYAAGIYIADVNVQIAAAESALNSSVKNQEKLVKLSETLKSDTQKNAKEKTELERKIDENSKELKVLESEELRVEGRLKDVKATENHEEQQKLLKESLSITNNIEKNKQQKVSLENKLKENEKDRLQLIEDTKTNASNIAASNEEVAKMAKAVEVVKEKLKIYQ
ncbi:hypothetical protein [Cytophaga aurantiaca]|uniref:hypothetical protein n=1 Tax=Cytophaga aurantiaca TaxID=29530 RepID=UPI00036714FD|nr:hypothetical protein [Cytophaga aurantiaca]